jgi:IMP dehydrogenase
MVGSILAGTQEAPGDIIGKNQEKYKVYRGMASRDAQTEFFGNAPNAPEGVSVTVPYRGPAYDVVSELIGGISSGLSYSGAINLEELRQKAVWIKITSAAAREALTIRDR